ncbi:MAG: type IV pilus assembly protein PilM [Planctomycetes bacterium]|nr:type IV pilus assembly protein PilM [Planctomycetota bacterium]
MTKAVWGIELSKSSLKAVRLERIGQGITLTHTGVLTYSGRDNGVKVDPDMQIREALAGVKAKYKIGGERVALSLSGQATFNRLIKLPPVEASRIHEVVKYEAQSQIPFPIDQVVWNFQFVDRRYGPGEEREVILFAVKKEILEHLLENIRDVGLNVEAIQFGPVALYNFLSYDQEIADSCIAVDVGATNADLLVIDGPKYWVRSLPITGNDITKAVQKAFSVSFDEAERLRSRPGSPAQAQNVFQAMRPVLREFMGEVHRSIGYYKSISKRARFEKVLLLGDALRAGALQKFVSQELQLPAARINKLHRIRTGGSLDAAHVAETLPTLGTALGLALQGLGETRNRVNLLPPEYVKRREMNRKRPLVAAAVVLLYALVGFMMVDAQARVGALAANMEEGRRLQADMEQLQGQMNDVVGKAAALERPLQRVEAFERNEGLLLRAINLVHSNIPDNCLAGLQDADRLWLLEWDCESMPIAPPAPRRIDGREVVSAPATWDPRRKWVVRMEVALLAANRSDSRMEEYLIQNLLGAMQVGSAWKKNPNKSSVVDEFALVRSMEGPQRFEIKPLGRTRELEPSSLQDRGAPPSEGEYALFQITLEIPLDSAEARAAEHGPSAGGVAGVK